MKKQLISLAIVTAFTFCAPLAMAQSSSSAMAAPATSAAKPADTMMPNRPMMRNKQMMKRDRMHMRSMRMRMRMMGRHMMPSTVNSVDHKTGIVDLTSLGMHLQVHFPPSTITELKAGDEINLLLGYQMRPAPAAKTPATKK